MSISFAFALQMLDPRGRCDRRGLLVAALVILMLQTTIGLAFWLSGADLTGPAALSVKAFFLYVAVSAAAKRLHDLGRSGWWMLAGVVGLVVWSTVLAVGAVFVTDLEALKPDQPVGMTVMALTMVPAFAALLWLHFAKGEAGPNRFGAVPDETGIGAPAPRQPAPMIQPTPVAG